MSGPVRTKDEMHRYLTYFSQGLIKGTPCPVSARLLREGRWFTGRASSNDCEVTRRWAKRMRPQSGECFYNSQRFCLAHDGYAYFEGFYFIGGWPMPHAWVVNVYGAVVDFTLEAVLRRARRNRTEYDDRPPLYRGIRIDTDLLRQRVTAGPRRPNPLRLPYLFPPKEIRQSTRSAPSQQVR